MGAACFSPDEDSSCIEPGDAVYAELRTSRRIVAPGVPMVRRAHVPIQETHVHSTHRAALALLFATACTGPRPALEADDLVWDTDTDAIPPDRDAGLLALPAAETAENDRFATADVCGSCHDNVPSSSAMRDAAGNGIAPYDLWQGSMMANAGRDPLWRAVVSAEMAETPDAAEAIEQKCLTCHAPMASTDAALVGDARPGLGVLTEASTRAQLALDGVSCTLCHQIEPDGLGSEATFSGAFPIEATGVIYGPHADPFAHPMEMHSGFSPVQSDHVSDSALCAPCHTLTTDALDDAGTPTGGHVLEQGSYIEWQLSDFADQTSCQDCHLPSVDDSGQPIATAIAHNPNGGDFGSVGPRSPVGRHLLVGGNTLIPQMLEDFRDILQPRASDAAFDATLAATRAQLSERTATVAIDNPVAVDGTLAFDVQVSVQTGHKLPTGIPLRRTWMRARVTDASGAVVFENGTWDLNGSLLGADGALLPSERVGGPIAPHVDQVTSADAVPVWEAVLADASGAPTFRLMRGEGWVKDNRMLPAGFDLDAAVDAEVAPVGVEGDPDFAPGSDVVHYSLNVSGAQSPLTIEVELVYQPLSARWAAELFTVATDEVASFEAMLRHSDRGPERIALETVVVP
jgi:hypothetical protein